MADERKHEEPLPNLDPTVEVVERESLLDKIPEKPSSPSSLKSKVYRLFGRERPVHKVLGGGKRTLTRLIYFMWKNKKVSGGATVSWVLFELIEYHLLALLCHLMIVSLAALFLWSNVTMFLHKSPPMIPQVHIPEEPLLQLASGLRIEINRGFSYLREIASGRDLKKFLSAIFGLCILSILGGCCSFLTLAYIALVLLFTVPLIYEDKVDSYGEKAMAELNKQYSVLDAKMLSKIPRGPLKNKKKDFH
ncbi:hypothetical protein BRARA_I02478 [Brassica rapa]|uniref:Reticulon-like protein n=1 Tax=Brassica campestris TaxID=3711 RepID=A0A397Y595_BRACM|nr:hypothetical protein BRARA_I02478 [Brassica rapa]